MQSLCDRQEYRAVQALQYPQIQLLPLDVTDDSAIKLVVDTVIANDGRIDDVVNNAGIGCYGVL